MKRGTLLRVAAALWWAKLLAISVAAEIEAAAPATAPVSSGTIVQDGETFQLANSTSTQSVRTDEFALVGEKIDRWTQLVTVQQITLETPRTPEAFVAYFGQRVREDGASIDVITQNATASVFGVRFPACDRNEEQVMVCLAFSDPSHPGVLNVLQYAIKPGRCSLPAAMSHIKTWRDKFAAQAKMMTAQRAPAGP